MARNLMEDVVVLKCAFLNLLDFQTNVLFLQSGKKIAICTDGQAALNAISSSVITSNLVKDCLCGLNGLGTSNSVVLVWVPGHSDVYGN
uniref:Uncharacterized protein n=1 Tax=Megaselia scalaris TaxID=36166 RepID=T1GQL1_MEGSC